MPFRPNINEKLQIDQLELAFCEHPRAPGMVYGQAGRQAIVYQVRERQGNLYALKVFYSAFRSSQIVEQAKHIKPYENLPGLQACSRIVLTNERNGDLLNKYGDLEYAVLMPWVEGKTWNEILISRRLLDADSSRLLAEQFLKTLASMQSNQLAHCDISGSNVIVQLSQESYGRIGLVDLESLYVPGLTRPVIPISGSAGYVQPQSNDNAWGFEADRFALSILTAEILGWCDEGVRGIAYGEQYFDPKEMQTTCDRFLFLNEVLRKRWGQPVADVFNRAWYSLNNKDCPSAIEWVQALNLAGNLGKGNYPPGTILYENYRVEAFLGRGSSGDVYKVTHLALNTLRAIKVFRRDTPGISANRFDEIRQRFELEAQFGEYLKSPYLLQVYGVLIRDDILLLEMEYAPGGNLEEKINKFRQLGKTFPVHTAVNIARVVASALGDLQSRDIVHRNLKPSNILFDEYGRVRLADLGLSQIPHGSSMRSQLSLSSHHPGTLQYMSPEQEKTFDLLKPSSDVYALGLVLFEMLTGTTYRFRNPEIPIENLRRTLSGKLFFLLMEMLADSPKDRPQDGSEVGKLLQQINWEEDISAKIPQADLTTTSMNSIPFEPRKHLPESFSGYFFLASVFLLITISITFIGAIISRSIPFLHPLVTPGVGPSPSFTINPSPSSTITITPLSLTTVPVQTLTLQAAFATIDNQFNNLLKSSIAFNRPEKMNLDETAIIEFILNPSLSESDLATQIIQRNEIATSTAVPMTLISPNGQEVTIETSQIEITPRLKVELLSQNPDAFIVTDFNDSAEQAISSTETTAWRWSVIAKKEGNHTLELVVYQLVKYDEKELWHEVETYKAKILVEVTSLQKIQALNWEWIIGIALTLLLVPAFWRWYDNKYKKPVEENSIGKKPKPLSKSKTKDSKQKK